MGISMEDNIHAPTVSSGESSGGATPPKSNMFKLSVPDLTLKKELIEHKLSTLSGVLKSHGVNMDTPLTTEDGFPRNDIDVAQIRNTRAQIIHLRNDHKEVMAHIEQRVYEHFKQYEQTHFTSPPAYTTIAATAPRAILLDDATLTAGPAFAKVTNVVSGSPADQAGLEVGDTIKNFAGVNWTNHENLSKIAQVVQKNEGCVMNIKVSRKDESREGQTKDELMQIVPRPGWGGRGLLGCHIVLI
jgi:26S proteasome non-ATPase regulatory subunit 9